MSFPARPGIPLPGIPNINPSFPERNAFDKDVENMVIGIQIQESRKRLNMTQEQLARKVNKKREYGIVEIGLGGKLHIEVIL